MQKIAYLMNELRVSCGDYSFIRTSDGYYSCRINGLIMDMSDEIANMQPLEFDERSEKVIAEVKKLVNNIHETSV